MRSGWMRMMDAQDKIQPWKRPLFILRRLLSSCPSCLRLDLLCPNPPPPLLSSSSSVARQRVTSTPQRCRAEHPLGRDGNISGPGFTAELGRRFIRCAAELVGCTPESALHNNACRDKESPSGWMDGQRVTGRPVSLVGRDDAQTGSPLQQRRCIAVLKVLTVSQLR